MKETSVAEVSSVENILESITGLKDPEHGASKKEIREWFVASLLMLGARQYSERDEILKFVFDEIAGRSDEAGYIEVLKEHSLRAGS